MNTVLQVLTATGFGALATDLTFEQQLILQREAAEAAAKAQPRSKIEIGVGVAVAALLLYAGYRRGLHIEESCGEKCGVVLPTLGWSLLGPVGPGYLVGRLVSPAHGG